MIASTAKVSVGSSSSSRLNSILTITAICVAVSLAVAIKLRVEPKSSSRDAVLRMFSPDSNTLAVVYEQSGDARSPFNYQIELTGDDQRKTVAEISGAMRNDRAYGVNLRWSGNSLLSIDYLSSLQEKLLIQDVTVAGRKIHIVLHSGVRDEDAPPGGMLFNLLQRL